MPLGGLFSGGVFETWVGGNEYRPRVRVLVHDETGLVRAAIGLSDGAPSAGSTPAGSQRSYYWRLRDSRCPFGFRPRRQ